MQNKLVYDKSESGTYSKCCQIELKFQIQCDIIQNRQNVKFEQFTIRFDILTQKRYELDLIRPEIENQSKRYPIDPKHNMWYDQDLGNQCINFYLIPS
jgi:hypothetical protein